MTQDSLTKPSAPPQQEPIKVSFSLPQIIGGALAAATAAAIGSQLGVAGTIVGAAVASIVGGIGGTLYSAGIDRTHRKMAGAIQRARQLDAEPSGVVSVLADDQEDELGATSVDLAPPPPELPEGPNRRLLLKRMAISVAVMFAVALLVVTAVELGLGRTLNGTPGTSLGQVSGQRDPAVPASTKPSTLPTATVRVTVSVTPPQSAPAPTSSIAPTQTQPATPTPFQSQAPSPAPTAS